MITLDQAVTLIHYKERVTIANRQDFINIANNNPLGTLDDTPNYMQPSMVRRAFNSVRTKKEALQPSSSDKDNTVNIVLARIVLQLVEEQEEQDENETSLFTKAALIVRSGFHLARAVALMTLRFATTIVRLVSTIVLQTARVTARAILYALRFIAKRAIAHPVVFATLSVLGAKYWYDRRTQIKEQEKLRQQQTHSKSIQVGVTTSRSGYTQTPSRRKPSTFKPKKGIVLPAEIEAEIERAALSYGLEPATMKAFAYMESKGDPNAYNPSGASGVFQFMPSTARMYNLVDPFDPVANIDAGMRLAKDNIRTLVAKGVISNASQITPGLLYLAHQQGAGGLAILTRAANAGKKVSELSEKMQRNVRANVGGKSEYVSEFLAINKAHIESYRAAFLKPKTTTGNPDLKTNLTETVEAPAKPAQTTSAQHTNKDNANVSTSANQTMPVRIGNIITRVKID